MKIELTAEEVTEIIRTWGRKQIQSPAPGTRVEVQVSVKTDGGAVIAIVEKDFPTVGGDDGSR